VIWIDYESLAHDVRRHANLRLTNGYALDADRIALEYLGYDVERRTKFQHDGRKLLGACFFDEDLIVIEEIGFVPRLRFTMAHEIGHALNDPRIDPCGAFAAFRCDQHDIAVAEEPMGRGKSDRARSEYLANRFASALLMPRDEMPRGSLSQTERARLAAHYGVSKHALDLRLSQINPGFDS